MKKLLALLIIGSLLTGCANDTKSTPTDKPSDDCTSYDLNDWLDPCWQPPNR